MSIFNMRAILNIDGEDAVWQTVQEWEDPGTGDKIDETTSDIDIKAMFEDIRTEERVLYPGELSRVTVRVYILPTHSVSIGDRILRYPDTSNEISYTIMTIAEFSSYKELELKKVGD